MNELLQKHGCSNVFTIPEGLKELMADITREVLREQPPRIFNFIANYLSVLLITREHGIMAVKILDDLCDCKPSVSEHLLQLGFERNEAEMLSTVIKQEIEGFEPVEGKEKVREVQILRKILARIPLDEDMSTKVCQVARNAYKNYWYRKKLMEESLKVSHDEPWEIAARHTLEIYKKTKPSFSELTRATEKIQAAYRGYYVRRNLLNHLKRKKKSEQIIELPGPPLDIAASREIDLGPVIEIEVKVDNVGEFFEDVEGKKSRIRHDPTRTRVTLMVDDEEFLGEEMALKSKSRVQSRAGMSSKSLTSRSQMQKSFADTTSRLDATSKQSRIKQSMSQMISETISKVGISESVTQSEVSHLTEDYEDASEYIPEETGLASDFYEYYGGEASEVTPGTVGEAQEIPEDISEFVGDEEISVPATSAPSSIPDTDVEDNVGEVTTGEEEEA